jgi:site-specific DNA-methyltransferase (adenine-specific)
MKLIHGNCLDYLHQIPEGTFFISDPPYNQKYHYNKYGDDLDKADYQHLLLRVFGNRKSVVILYPEETINLLGGGNMGDVSEVVSWVYPSNTGKQSSLVSWWNCKPDFRKIPQPYKNPTDKRIAKRIADGKSARSYDWWEINQVKNVSKKENPHPCPIPLALAEKIILSTTEPGDTVCDPFMGSGTIGIACKKHGRDFIGIELDETYYKHALASL